MAGLLARCGAEGDTLNTREVVMRYISSQNIAQSFEAIRAQVSKGGLHWKLWLLPMGICGLSVHDGQGGRQGPREQWAVGQRGPIAGSWQAPPAPWE